MRRLVLLAKNSALILAVLWIPACAGIPKDSNPRKGLFEVLGSYRSRHVKPQVPRESLANRVQFGSSGKELNPTRPSKGGAVAGVRPSGTHRRLQSATQSWQWPLKEVQLTSVFGRRGKKQHEGVDLRAKVGTPVFASHSGEVVYSDDQISGYGKMVILKDSNGLFSLYAHNSKLKTTVGEKVKRGQLIAYSGNSGSSTGPHVHFEVRSGVVALDPETVLPPLKGKSVSLVKK